MNDFLNRYTSLPMLLDLLMTRQFTLRTPELWEDRNDAFYLDRYKDRKALKVLLAVCFTTTRETFHHWKCFSNGSSGVCIEFRKANLLKEVEKNRGFRHGPVAYKFVDEVKKNHPELKAWPFLKRWPFRDEREFRIIYESVDPADKTTGFAFSLASIRRITVSPWLARPVADNVISVIRSLPDCADLAVVKSGLLENTAWRKAVS